MIAAATFGFISYFVGNALFSEYLPDSISCKGPASLP
jgi:hypothetical protein